uniref:Uncharacterized protein n=1 Tax=Entomoneis paludosa TaxID=265537 RepID=A0A7S2YNL6_9STRA|mmetsp:Transcript_40269/g.83865  ORF Transcript_40269/g.83865 Transcript_40269/m.83865 type:complete len:194 (+) Transcript_40269:220-801(+)|eukprot:CAMPEP_0172461082 /NCGR_PEP_ID=MMETSP1065-20121228/39377_1 /TAXON_ID=265537 /ORGANISM="Amphiprora paludosa, Strain CCMP125" /LENGTH=193 /DNA_ID=CAMNT_0013216295 /DNA_START=116 /DNA_END=697 /DNA_ORIENTATION=-
MADKFEKERETILKSLPANVKSMFRTMGFCRVEVDSDDEDAAAKKQAGDDFAPCLILSPYDVPPRPVRDTYWHQMYMAAKRSKKLGEMDYLVYQYGHDDPEDCYSFVAVEDFKSYDDGLKAGFGELPAALQAKVDAGTALTEDEQIRVRALEEMREDASKKPEERLRGNFDFLERHETEEFDDIEPSKKKQKK